MLIQTPGGSEVIRTPQGNQRLWHYENENALSIGCASCVDRKVCGGLEVARAVFDCSTLCCGEPARCDSICRKKPLEFAQRVREISGFGLENVPRSEPLDFPALPNLVPMLLHGKKRNEAFSGAPAVCIPLYEVIAKHNGEPRFTDPRGLTHGFKVSREARIILTGTATDPPLERWWSLGTRRRRECIRSLRELGVSLVTTPNFSLFTDRPRWDDLHSIKRIALVYEEFMSEGLPTALHVNARTDHDWARWQDFVRARPEVTHLAFEFATGAGYGRRIRWHSKHLAQLATSTDRPLHLVIRGGARALPVLCEVFSRVTLLETSAFVKTVKRQRATVVNGNTLHWSKSPTKKNEPLDRLLADNWRDVSAAHASAFEGRSEAFSRAAK